MHISYILQLVGIFFLSNSRTYSDNVMALESLRNGVAAEFSLSFTTSRLILYRGGSVSNDINKNHMCINKNRLLIYTFK